MANKKISSQCTKLVEIIENAKQETLYENEARFRASDDGHKALMADVEKAQAAALDERVPLGEIGKNVEKVKAEFGGQFQSEKVAYESELKITKELKEALQMEASTD